MLIIFLFVLGFCIGLYRYFEDKLRQITHLNDDESTRTYF